jgi:hypothetical protein
MKSVLTKENQKKKISEAPRRALYHREKFLPRLRTIGCCARTTVVVFWSG